MSSSGDIDTVLGVVSGADVGAVGGFMRLLRIEKMSRGADGCGGDGVMWVSGVT